MCFGGNWLSQTPSSQRTAQENLCELEVTDLPRPCTRKYSSGELVCFGGNWPGQAFGLDSPGQCDVPLESWSLLDMPQVSYLQAR